MPVIVKGGGVDVVHLGGSTNGPTLPLVVTVAGTGYAGRLASWTMSSQQAAPVFLKDGPNQLGHNHQLHVLTPPTAPKLAHEMLVSALIREGNLWLTTWRVLADGTFQLLDSRGYGAYFGSVPDYTAMEAATGGVKLSDTEPFDFYLKAWYASMMVMLTGERPQLKGGVLERIRPLRDFDIRTGGWGALGLGLMYQQFEAEKIVYESLVYQGQSVRRANSLTVALNWYLNAMIRLSLDYSRTKFRDPLYLGEDESGNSYYRDVEHAWMARLQLEF